MPVWDSAQYLRFARERTQPARDLAARIELPDGAEVLDLGCGPGNSTQVLADHFAGAHVTGADNSVPMLERARAHMDSHTYKAADYDELREIIENKPGFVKAMWCGDRACEDKIKEDLAATSRCMPFEQEQISDVCVCCGKPAKKMVYWGRSY